MVCGCLVAFNLIYVGISGSTHSGCQIAAVVGFFRTIDDSSVASGRLCRWCARTAWCYAQWIPTRRWECIAIIRATSVIGCPCSICRHFLSRRARGVGCMAKGLPIVVVVIVVVVFLAVVCFCGCGAGAAKTVGRVWRGTNFLGRRRTCVAGSTNLVIA